MKKMLFKLYVVAILFSIASCSVSNNVVNHSMIQKRKVNKGFFFKSSKVDLFHSDVAKQVERKQLKEGSLMEPSPKTVESAVPQDQQTAAPNLAPTETDAQVTVVSPAPKSVKKNAVEANETSDQSSLELKQQHKKGKNEHQQTVKQAKEAIRAKRVNPFESSSNSMDDDQLIALLLAILLPPLGVLFYTDFDVKKTLICLLLTFLFWLPGFIYALLVIFDRI